MHWMKAGNKIRYNSKKRYRCQSKLGLEGIVVSDCLDIKLKVPTLPGQLGALNWKSGFSLITLCMA
jgi:hypothetical protein